MKPRTQRTRLLSAMRRQWVTPLDALRLCDCLSLAQRVSELIREGVNITKDWRKLPSGKQVRAYRIFG